MGATWYQHYGRRMTDCEKQKVYAAKHPDRIKERNANRDFANDYAKQKERILKDPRSYILKSALKRARKNGREFSITIDDIIIPTHCPVFGYELVALNEGKAGDNSMSLDRIDNKLGYIPGNVIVVSNRANILKKDATVAELEALVNFYKEREQ